MTIEAITALGLEYTIPTTGSWTVLGAKLISFEKHHTHDPLYFQITCRIGLSEEMDHPIYRWNRKLLPTIREGTLCVPLYRTRVWDLETMSRSNYRPLSPIDEGVQNGYRGSVSRWYRAVQNTPRLLPNPPFFFVLLCPHDSLLSSW